MDLRLCFDRLELGHIVGWDVSFLFGQLAAGQPPVTLGVIDDLKVLPLLEAQVFIRSGVIVIQGNKDFCRGVCVVLLWLCDWQSWCYWAYLSCNFDQSLLSAKQVCLHCGADIPANWRSLPPLGVGLMIGLGGAGCNWKFVACSSALVDSV